MKILVSACLLGRNCKYNGGNNLSQRTVEYLRGHEVIEMCPELLAGLGVPRTPIEIVSGVLMDKDGNKVDAVLRTAAEKAAAQAKAQGIELAVLQSRSPTCGVNQVYDGTFTGKLIPGHGVFAQALMDAGIRVVDAENL